MRIWLSRAAALLALVGAAAAIAVAVAGVDPAAETTPEQSRDLMMRLAQTNAGLGERLNALQRGDSPREAQDATRSTADQARLLDAQVEGDTPLARQLHEVFRAELDYLDAVGSTLNNPRSALRGKVGPLAQALRDVLQQVPGGDHRAVAGGMNLVMYSEARAGE